MAVKQNNTESNEGQSQGMGGGGGGGGSGGSAQKGKNVDGGGGGDGKSPPTSVQKILPTQDENQTLCCTEICRYFCITYSTVCTSPVESCDDITHVLHLIEMIERREELHSFHDEIRKIYQLIIIQLARVKSPLDKDELEDFKVEVLKVGKFFARETDKAIYNLYLRAICQLITQNTTGPPSNALAVIFNLFDIEMIYSAVRSLLSMKISDDEIRKTCALLSEWLYTCTFCHNIVVWLLAVLNELVDQQRYGLVEEISLDNIDEIFLMMMTHFQRVNTSTLIYLMLNTVTNSPRVFHKFLSKLLPVSKCLRVQAENDTTPTNEPRQMLQRVVDITNAMMVRFPGNDTLYDHINQSVFRGMKPSPNFTEFLRESVALDNDALMCETNTIRLQNGKTKVGLINLGNTCYMNSVLQALAMTTEFSREILLVDTLSPLLYKMKQQIALMLYSMRPELTPTRILDAICTSNFTPGQQQDSSEFLSVLLEKLHHTELVFSRKSKAIVALMNGDVESPTQSPREPPEKMDTDVDEEDLEMGQAVKPKSYTELSPFKNDTTPTPSPLKSEALKEEPHSSSEDGSSNVGDIGMESKAAAVIAQSIIDKTFSGKFATTFKCLSCGNESRNVDSFLDLQLSFPQIEGDCAPNYSVQDLVDYFCSTEKLDGDNQYLCTQCGKKTDAERFVQMVSAPKYLILTLKHFKYDQLFNMRAKLMHKVFHDEKVSLRVCSSESLKEIACVYYDLYAGVVHAGMSMDSGHYYTYAADAENKWYKFNDNIVTASALEELHNLTPPHTPYILFYQMSGLCKEPISLPDPKLMRSDTAPPLTLEELPSELRDYVRRDNTAYANEVRKRRFQPEVFAQNRLYMNGNGGDRDQDEDDDDFHSGQPPPTGGCGGNALNFNVNRFVY